MSKRKSLADWGADGDPSGEDPKVIDKASVSNVSESSNAVSVPSSGKETNIKDKDSGSSAKPTRPSKSKKVKDKASEAPKDVSEVAQASGSGGNFNFALGDFAKNLESSISASMDRMASSIGDSMIKTFAMLAEKLSAQTPQANVSQAQNSQDSQPKNSLNSRPQNSQSQGVLDQNDQQPPVEEEEYVPELLINENQNEHVLSFEKEEEDPVDPGDLPRDPDVPVPPPAPGAPLQDNNDDNSGGYLDEALKDTQVESKVGGSISEKSARLIDQVFTNTLSDLDYKKRVDKNFLVPENAPWLKAPRVEKSLFVTLERDQRCYENLVQQAQEGLSMSMRGIIKAMDQFETGAVRPGFRILTETLQVSAYCHKQVVSEGRKKQLSFHVNSDYKTIVAHDKEKESDDHSRINPDWLLGNVKEKTKVIAEDIKLSKQLAQKMGSSRGSRPKRLNNSRGHSSGRGMSRESPGFQSSFRGRPGSRGRGSGHRGSASRGRGRGYGSAPVRGNVRKYFQNWSKLTSDPFVLECVQGVKIPFESMPFQGKVPAEYKFDRSKASVVSEEISNLLAKEAIIEVEYDKSMFISNIFLVPKPDGSSRVIIDLSKLNEFIQKESFKMDSLETAKDLMRKNVWMASLDLKDAYFSLPIAEEFQKFLVFQWDGKFYKYVVLPFGITLAPRVFTKVMKPVLVKMRQLGFHIVAYLDDFLLLDLDRDNCVKAVSSLQTLFDSLGLLVNVKKSCLIPKQQIVFLGYMLDSVSMVVKPTEEKRAKVVAKIQSFLGRKFFSIQEGASLIGLLNDLCKGTEYGLAYVKNIEMDKIQALRGSHGDWQGSMSFSSASLSDLQWWLRNVIWREKALRIIPPESRLETDASDLGWGGVLFLPDGSRFSCNGRWSSKEKCLSINVRELLAIWFSLLTLREKIKCLDIKILCDNVTAVANVRKMGSVKSKEANRVAKAIWSFCEERCSFIWISHLPGVENCEADLASRFFTDDTEWALNPKFFKIACAKWGCPDIDLFASRNNKLLENYCSWVPDPFAKFVDAFSVNWGQFGFIYVFPPYRLMGRVLNKIQQEGVKALVVAPAWFGQPWASVLNSMKKEQMFVKSRKDNIFILRKGTMSASMKLPLWLTLC